MQIRHAANADVPAILEIYNEQVRNSTATYDEEPDTPEDRAAWLEEHDREGYPVLVAEDAAGQVVGWASLSRFRAKVGYRFTVENSVYVAPDRRGQGVGRALLAALLQAARARGFHAVVAGIDADAEASLRLHAAFGFEEVAHFRQVGRKFGRWLDVVFMERLLDDPTREDSEEYGADEGVTEDLTR